MSRHTREQFKSLLIFRIRGCHSLWPSFPACFSRLEICNSLTEFRLDPNCPTTPLIQRPEAWHINGLGYSAFARRYLRNRFYFLFLQVLRWFTSLSLLTHTMYSCRCNTPFRILGFPIRTSPVHRLFASPRSFSQLATSFFACCDQGIHPVLLGT